MSGSGSGERRSSKRRRTAGGSSGLSPPPPPPIQTQKENGGNNPPLENIHPLLNPVVIERLVEYIHSPYLCSFRLVCSAWKNVSQSKFREKCIFHVGPMSDNQFFQLLMAGHLHCFNNAGRTNVNQARRIWRKLGSFFTKNSDSLVQHPFRKFDIRSLVFTKEVLSKKCVTSTLLRYLPFLHQLTLEGVRLDTHSIPILHSVLFENTPNLEFLEVTNVSEIEDSAVLVEPLEYPVKKDRQQLNLKTFMASVEKNAVFSWVDIFSWFPNIQKLRLSVRHISELSLVLSSLSATNIANGQTSCITDFILEAFDPDEPMTGYRLHVDLPLVEQLLQDVYPQLPLQNLSVFNVNNIMTDTSLLRTLLTNQQHSVKKLVLTQLSIEDMAIVTAIPMPNLEQVILRRLGLASGLHIEHFSSDFDKLFLWMKYVQRLEMDMCNVMFRAVCKNCVTLTHLSVIEGCTAKRRLMLDDKGITGLEWGQGKKFLENLERSGLQQRPANITDLKELKVFQIKRDYVKFSDKSVYFGFLKLDHLKTLKIPEAGLSAKAKAELCRHLASSK